MARRYKSTIYAIHGVQFPDSSTPQTLTYPGYATPVGQIFRGYATPVGQIFSGVATPVGQIFYSYATPLYGALPSGGTAGQILTKADSTDYSVYWQTMTPFQGYATPLGLQIDEYFNTTVFGSLTTISNLVAEGDLTARNLDGNQVKVGSRDDGQPAIIFGYAQDAELYRDSAGILKIPGQLLLGTDYAVRYRTGTLANRPTATPANAGMFYYATNGPALFASDGTSWATLAATPFQGYATPLGQVFTGFATPTGQIQTNQIADSAVTTAKIANGAVQPFDMATPFTGFATPLPGTTISTSAVANTATKVFALFLS